MTPLAARRLLAPALLLLPVLSACVSTPSNPSAARASVLAGIVSRASACNAGYARRDTLDRFLQAERARGSTRASGLSPARPRSARRCAAR
ncbi:MAG: hypothetical protein ABS59_17415 [Methylobacterium sp. SCN 67-24]|nr:MAG: hypothetical protein ABS59_17415 [Methylobacterium sp. SCN 67-24]